MTNTAHKVIRIIWRTVKISLLSVTLLLLSLYILLQFSFFQTWLGKKATNYLSEELHTKCSIGRIDIDFFNRVFLEDVYLEDTNGDTLLYGGMLDLWIADLSYKNRFVKFKELRLHNVDFSLKQSTDGLNVDFLADYFSPADTSMDTTSSDFKISYGDLILDNVRFRFHDLSDTFHLQNRMNFQNLDVQHISGKFRNISITDDSVFVEIKNLTAKEKCGFEIKNLSTIASVSPRLVQLDSLWLQTGKSYLHGFYSMKTKGWDSYNDYISKVRMKAKLRDSSHVHFSDIGYFAKEMVELDEDVKIEGLIKGTVADLSGEKINLEYGNHTRFIGDFAISGIPVQEEMFLHLNIKQLSTSRSDLITITLPASNGKKIDLHPSLSSLGVTTFKGTIDGMLNELAIYGNFNTALGKIRTDVGFSLLKDKEKWASYHGIIKTDGFDFGKFLSVPGLGKVAMETKISGTGLDINHLDATLEGKVPSLTYNDYSYKSLEVNGTFRKRLFHGKFLSNDENAKVDFYGDVDLTGKLPNADFVATIEHLDLAKLHFIKSDSAQYFSTQVLLQLQGNDINDLTGNINFDNTIYHRGKKEFKLSSFDLKMEHADGQKIMAISSGIADFKMKGNFQLTELPNALRTTFDNYFPTFAKATSAKKIVTYADKFSYSLRIKKFNLIRDLFMPDLMVSNGTIISGDYLAMENKISVNAISNLISYKDFRFNNWRMILTGENKEIQFDNSLSRLSFNDSSGLNDFIIKSQIKNEKSNYTISWDNQTSRLNKGEITGDLSYTETTLDISVKKFDVYLDSAKWYNLNPECLAIDTSGALRFYDLAFYHDKQMLGFVGAVSRDPKDILELVVQEFDLAQLNPLLKSSGVKLGGVMNGMGNISDVYGKVLFSNSFDFNYLTINDNLIGRGEINTYYDKTKDLVSLNGYFNRDIDVISAQNFNNLHFEGYYFPGRKTESLDIDIHLNTIQLKLLQPFLEGIFTIDKGYVSGKAKVTGTPQVPKIDGALDALGIENFKVDYLNTIYRGNGKVTIEPDRIALEPLHLYDVNKNSATLYGNIFHNNFKNIKLDFDIQANKFQCLNTTLDNNRTFYGKAYATATIGIYGPPNYLNFEIYGKTEKGTQFNIPLSEPAEVTEKGFIRFVKKDTSSKEVEHVGNKMSLTFNLEVTDAAEVQIIFDKKAGDVIKARGNGNINMAIKPGGDFEMMGLYTIVDGSYGFTLENIINKKFDIDNGGTIKWTGDPYNANINIAATYKQRSTLAPFFPPSFSNLANQSGNASGQSGNQTTAYNGLDRNKRYPVDCKLYMRDKLLTPDITFGIELPSVPGSIRSEVMSYINNEQELNRQVFSLLLLKSFVTPLQLQNPGMTANGTAMGSNASELLSNQLSNWLSQLSKDVNIGVNYRPGDKLSNEELNVALSTQLFNDKLSIDGNFGVNNNLATRTSTLIGDLNIDYKLTEDGKFRVKAFNRSNDNFQIATQGGGLYTQGAGIFYREEFNTWGDLARRYWRLIKREGKKEEEPGIE